MAVLKLASALLLSENETDRRIVCTGGQIEEGILPSCGVASRIASYPAPGQVLALAGKSAKQANTMGMRRRASREGDRPIDFLKCRDCHTFCFHFLFAWIVELH